jgi:hypothetical protein
MKTAPEKLFFAGRNAIGYACVAQAESSMARLAGRDIFHAA